MLVAKFTPNVTNPEDLLLFFVLISDSSFSLSFSLFIKTAGLILELKLLSRNMLISCKRFSSSIL